MRSVTLEDTNYTFNVLTFFSRPRNLHDMTSAHTGNRSDVAIYIILIQILGTAEKLSFTSFARDSVVSKCPHCRWNVKHKQPTNQIHADRLCIVWWIVIHTAPELLHRGLGTVGTAVRVFDLGDVRVMVLQRLTRPAMSAMTDCEASNSIRNSTNRMPNDLYVP